MSETPPLTVEGTLAGREPSGLWKILLGVTGLSLVIGLWRVFARLALGGRQRGKLTLEPGQLVLEEEAHLLGRPTRTSRETFARASVLSVKLDTRYPYLVTLAGLAGLGVGVIAGIFFLLDGLQGEFTPWIVTGVGLLVGGVALDLGLTTLASSMPGRTSLVVQLPSQRTVRLLNCDPEQAARVVSWLQER